MTCRTLFALISAAVLWNLPHNTMAQAKQEGSEQTSGTATNAKDAGGEGSSVLQMQAKKPPAKPKANVKKGKPPAKPAKPKTPVKPAPKPKPKPAPYFPPAPPVIPPVPGTPLDNNRFQVPIPEEKGDLNIWGDDPAAAAAEPIDPNASFNQIGVIGVVNYLGAGFGLEYLRRSLTWMDWGAQVNSTQAQLTDSRNPDTDEFLDTQMVSAKITARFFNSRWLSLNTGIAFNSIQGTFGWKGSGVANQEISTDFTAQMIQVDLALSSQWEPGKGFYLGVDWFGVGLPLSGSIDYDANADLDDLTRVLTGSTAEERIQQELSAQFLPYYLLIKFGYMF